jgi:hypothetical protein
VLSSGFTFLESKNYNTNDSYIPNILEFKAYYGAKYPGEGCTKITLEKVHKFMVYQIQSKKKKPWKGVGRLMDSDVHYIVYLISN